LIRFNQSSTTVFGGAAPSSNAQSLEEKKTGNKYVVSGFSFSSVLNFREVLNWLQKFMFKCHAILKPHN
jgi:hypothetical protein